MLYDKGDLIEGRFSRGAAAPFANGLSRGSQASQAESFLGSFFSRGWRSMGLKSSRVWLGRVFVIVLVFTYVVESQRFVIVLVFTYVVESQRRMGGDSSSWCGGSDLIGARFRGPTVRARKKWTALSFPLEPGARASTAPCVAGRARAHYSSWIAKMFLFFKSMQCYENKGQVTNFLIMV